MHECDGVTLNLTLTLNYGSWTHCALVPLCTRRIASLSFCAPINLDPMPILLQSHWYQTHWVPELLCTGPIVYQTHCVPVPLCTRPIVYRSHCVQVPLCNPNPMSYCLTLTLTHGLRLNGTGTQWDWHTMGLGHNKTGTQWDWQTMGHNSTDTQSDWHAIWLGHNMTGTQWDWDITELAHNGTGTQWQ